MSAKRSAAQVVTGNQGGGDTEHGGYPAQHHSIVLQEMI